MVNKLKSPFKLLLNDRVIQTSVAFALSSTLFVFFVFGIVSGFVVFLAYLFGYITSHYIFDYRAEITSAITAAVNTFRNNRDKNAKNLKCNVCGDENCDREKIVHKQKPWAGLMVPEEIDSALSSLLERILNEFVVSWYKNVSVDDCFPQELRNNIRYSVSVILSKALKINIGNLLTKRVVPVFLRHIEFVREVKIGKTPIYHPALYSRSSELDYLRYRVKEVLPFILEKPQMECRLFSVLIEEILSGWVLLPFASVSDPSVLMSLLNLTLAKPNLSRYPPTDASKKVEILSSFVTSSSGLHSNTALLPDMCSVMKDQSLLYAFMQFLKDQSAVHILQFCLDVEEFNKRMLSPELATDDLEMLYRDAWDIYSVYFSPHSPDNIGFSSDLVLHMRKVLSKDVTKLRTSPPLFQAYEFAYNLLDKTYCPQFHTSDEFYMWLCGPRTPKPAKSGSSSPVPGSPAKARARKNNEGAVLKLSNRVQKIKGALKSQAILDGQTYDPNPPPLEPGAEYGEELSEEETERDMSTWKVTVTSNENSKGDASISKLGIIFTLHIKTPTEDGGGSWRVKRRIADFYSLEGKLSEFHGEFPDNRLPPSGILSPSPPTQPQIYEEYLHKLLKMPSLKGSDLLHWFMTSSGDFALEDNGIGRLLKKSVGPLSLRKERGQNIEPFIAAYLTSTENKGKIKTDWKDYTYELSPRKKRCLTNTVFGNNLNLQLSSFPPEIEPAKRPQVPFLFGPSDCLLYIALKILLLPGAFVRLILGVLALFSSHFDTFCSTFIEKKICAILVPQRVAHLINLLQWVIFDKHTKTDPVELTNTVRDKISKLSGCWYKVYIVLFETFHDPMMNKQLFYSLFDIALEEIFPEKLKS